MKLQLQTQINAYIAKSFQNTNFMLQAEEDKILIQCRQFITELSLQYQDMRRVLYDDRLALFLEERVHDFAIEEQSEAVNLFVARLAALFYPMGFRINIRSPKQGIWLIAKTFLQERGLSSTIILDVETALNQSYGEMPQHQSAQLLSDALVGLYFDTEIHQWATLRQLEFDLLNGQSDRLAEAQLKLQELLAIRFSTNAGRRHWQIPLGQQLIIQKKKVEKLLRLSKTAVKFETEVLAFSELEEGSPIRGTQTFFRAIYRNHINLSAIADNKANIMISVNSILISVLITFISYRNIAETQPMILLPVIIFLVVGLASLVFAVLSARPKVTLDTASKKTNVAFFGSFVQLSEDGYQQAMNEVLNDSSLLYTNMVSDLYYLGKVLDRKYRYLSISYNIFMLGLVVTVGLFLFTLFYF